MESAGSAALLLLASAAGSNDSDSSDGTSSSEDFTAASRPGNGRALASPAGGAPTTCRARGDDLCVGCNTPPKPYPYSLGSFSHLVAEEQANDLRGALCYRCWRRVRRHFHIGDDQPHVRCFVSPSKDCVEFLRGFVMPGNAPVAWKILSAAELEDQTGVAPPRLSDSAWRSDSPTGRPGAQSPTASVGGVGAGAGAGAGANSGAGAGAGARALDGRTRKTDSPRASKRRRKKRSGKATAPLPATLATTAAPRGPYFDASTQSMDEATYRAVAVAAEKLNHGATSNASRMLGKFYGSDQWSCHHCRYCFKDRRKARANGAAPSAMLRSIRLQACWDIGMRGVTTSKFAWCVGWVATFVNLTLRA